MGKKWLFIFLAALLIIGPLSGDPSFADGEDNFQINLKVQPRPQDGDQNYLNQAEYEVYLKYKVNDEGKYIHPKTGVLVNNPIPKGTLPTNLEEDAVKVGVVTINGSENLLPIMVEGKNTPGSYILRPVKRAPGYHLDKRQDGKYAEVEFPLLEEGRPKNNQTAEISMKAVPVEKINFPLFIKKDSNGNPLGNVSFKGTKVGSFKKIDSSNRPVFHKDQMELTPPDNIVHTNYFSVDTNDSGELVITEPLTEGIYSIREDLEENGKKAHLKHIQGNPQEFFFEVFADTDGKTKIRFNNIRYVYLTKSDLSRSLVFPQSGEISVIPQNIFLDAKAEAEDGNGYSFYNYKKVLLEKSMILPNGDKSKKFSINLETPFLNETKIEIPKDYMFYEDFYLEESPSNRHILLFSIDAPAFTGKIEDLSEYTLDYKNFDPQIFSKVQIYHEFKDPVSQQLKTVAVDPALLVKDNEFHFGKTGVDKNFYFYFSGKKMREIISTNLGIDEMQMNHFEDLLDPGHLSLRYFVKESVKRAPRNWPEPVEMNESNLQNPISLRKMMSVKMLGNIGNNLEVAAAKPSSVTDVFEDSSSKFTGFSSKDAAQSSPARSKVLSVKVDAASETTTLPGAKFRIYKAGTDKLLTPFVSDTEEFVSEAEGKLTIENLPYFKEGYDLEEVAAPEGYRLPKARFHVSIKDIGGFASTDFATEHDVTAGSYEDTKITNVKRSGDITDTGTMGTLLFGLAGAGALGAGVKIRKKRK